MATITGFHFNTSIFVTVHPNPKHYYDKLTYFLRTWNDLLQQAPCIHIYIPKVTLTGYMNTMYSLI